MMHPSLMNKAKIARRVIEVLDYFDDRRPAATVMEIARHYDRPQSSTSELLACLVDMGLVQKDTETRTYSPTPRAALMGMCAQPELIRGGAIIRLLDTLREQTGMTITLSAKVGLETQIIQWRQGEHKFAGWRNFGGGVKDSVARNAAGWLFLSTLPRQRCEGTLRRLNAEADDKSRFHHAELLALIDQCRDRRYAFGPAGFDTSVCSLSALLPHQPDQHPLVVSMVYERADMADAEKLLNFARGAVRSSFTQSAEATADLPMPRAA